MERDFVLGVIGDFSGGGSASGRFHGVDRDEWPEVFARLAPRPAPGLAFCETLALEDWEAWRPEALAQQVPGIAGLLAARGAVEDPERARALLARAGVDVSGVEASAETQSSPAAPVSEGALLDDILAGRPASEEDEPVRVTRPSADPAFARMLHEIAEPHAERIDHARTAAWRDAIDAEIGVRLRALLRAPEVRGPEASWRALRALVWGTETDEALRIRVLDLPGAGLDGGAESEALRRRVVEEEHGTRGGDRFGLLLADRWLGAGDEDLARLAVLARVAAEADVACIAGAAAALWDPDADADAARAFLDRARTLPGAERVGLCAPGMLVRLPYGRSGDPVEGFAFEEVDERTGPAGYLWGNAAYAVAAAVASAVATTGRAADAPRFAQRESLPFHPRGSSLDPVGPTERVLPDRELERLRGAGLIPLAGVRGRDTAVVLSFQSLTGAPLWP